MEVNEILTLKSKAKLNCTLCEKCCEYRGDIKITPINVLQISDFLKISIEEFLEKYTDKVEGEEPEIVIKGIGEKRECIFNDRNNFKCMIQKVKPMQCIMFPLVPVDIKRDLFYNSEACPVNKDKETKVDKWINGNNKLYSKNKLVYLKWIELMEEIQPKWNGFSSEKQELIIKKLYYEYDLKKNYEKQILNAFKQVREIIYNS